MDLLMRIVLALVAVGFVGVPLLRERWADEDTEPAEDVEELYHRRESTYSALKELEFDYRTGKLSDTDYSDLVTKYREEALEVLGEIEGYEAGVDAEVNSEPTSRRGPAPLRLQPEPDAHADLVTCPECGGEIPAGARFCRECGLPVPRTKGLHALDDADA